MPLEDGDLASEDDVWLRVITNERYWRSDGRLHNSAFGGKAFQPPSGARPWTHELSGRLLSLVKALHNECVTYCGADFAGIMYQNVLNLRSEASGFATDVVYTPIKNPRPDDAHSDFVSFQTTQDDIWLIRDWLQDFIQHVKPNKVADVEAALRAAMQ